MSSTTCLRNRRRRSSGSRGRRFRGLMHARCAIERSSTTRATALRWLSSESRTGRPQARAAVEWTHSDAQAQHPPRGVLPQRICSSASLRCLPLTWIRPLLDLPDRGAAEPWFARLLLGGTGGQISVARRGGKHGPLRAAAAGANDPVSLGAGTSRNVPRASPSRGRGELAPICQRRVRGLSRMRHSGPRISACALC